MDAVGDDGPRGEAVNPDPRSVSGGEVHLENGEVEKGSDLAPASSSKGRGLRKWRRIRREPGREGSVGIDLDRKLKRGLSVPDPVKPPRPEEAETDSSVASADLGRTELPVLDPGLEVLIASAGFQLGYDSENSEDRSSKSSTAASGPRMRHELGFGRERSRGKANAWRGVLQQKAGGARARGGGGLDANKKSREDWLIADGRDASQSSVESDVRSSIAMVAQVRSSSSNGGQSKGSVNYDGQSVLQPGVDGPCRQKGEGDDGTVIGESSGCGIHGDNKVVEPDGEESFGSSHSDQDPFCEPNGDQDPFREPISELQAAKEALERELQMFEEIESVLRSDESEGANFQPPPSISHPGGLRNEQSKLGETAEPAETSEQEDISPGANQPPRKGSGGMPPHYLQDKFIEMELELENILRNKLEHEIECMVLHQTVRRSEANQHTLHELHKSLAGDYEKLSARLNDYETQVQDLQAAQQRQLRCNETWTSRHPVCSFFVELVLSVLVLLSFVLHLTLPSSDDYVPT